jgi:hypothetical protein
MKRLVLTLIRAYQLVVSPLLPPACRFYPSCSQYAREAVEQWGVRRGILLGAKRVVRCHPFGGQGIDLVPKRFPVPHVRCQEGKDSASACGS